MTMLLPVRRMMVSMAATVRLCGDQISLNFERGNEITITALLWGLNTSQKEHNVNFSKL